MAPYARTFILGEAIACFAIPLYFLFWGVLSLILMIPMALAGHHYAIFNCFVTLAGCLGAIALFIAVRFLVTGKGRAAAESPVLKILTAVALLALWAVVTDEFREFSADYGTLLLAGLPTFAAAHFVALIERRRRSSVAYDRDAA